MVGDLWYSKRRHYISGVWATGVSAANRWRFIHGSGIANRHRERRARVNHRHRLART
jgi:hypothetical protein